MRFQQFHELRHTTKVSMAGSISRGSLGAFVSAIVEQSRGDAQSDSGAPDRYKRVTSDPILVA